MKKSTPGGSATQLSQRGVAAEPSGQRKAAAAAAKAEIRESCTAKAISSRRLPLNVRKCNGGDGAGIRRRTGEHVAASV